MAFFSYKARPEQGFHGRFKKATGLASNVTEPNALHAVHTANLYEPVVTGMHRTGCKRSDLIKRDFNGSNSNGFDDWHG